MATKTQEEFYAEFPEMFPLTINWQGKAVRVHVGCDPGWFDLLWAFCETVREEYAHRKSRCDSARVYRDTNNPYWTDAICDEAEKAFVGVGVPTFEQIKEKFGTLRIYLEGNFNRPFVDGALNCVENMSARVCGLCGNPGTLRQNKWWRVRCETCEPTVTDAA